jgi:NitT/TauT family transport system permease protein
VLAPCRLLRYNYGTCFDEFFRQVIDVLQSIPLLSFLPGVVLGLIALFPAGARTGVELAAVLLLFTSMAWNMLLGFYQSLCCIPHDLLDVATSFRLNGWKRFWVVELPAGAIGLIWNSIISVAGGWYVASIISFNFIRAHGTCHHSGCNLIAASI